VSTHAKCLPMYGAIQRESAGLYSTSRPEWPGLRADGTRLLEGGQRVERWAVGAADGQGCGD
jgi:hypothetical protein